MFCGKWTSYPLARNGPNATLLHVTRCTDATTCKLSPIIVKQTALSWIGCRLLSNVTEEATQKVSLGLQLASKLTFQKSPKPPATSVILFTDSLLSNKAELHSWHILHLLNAFGLPTIQKRALLFSFLLLPFRPLPILFSVLLFINYFLDPWLKPGS